MNMDWSAAKDRPFNLGEAEDPEEGQLAMTVTIKREEMSLRVRMAASLISVNTTEKGAELTMQDAV